jgi:hypothetical protein
VIPDGAARAVSVEAEDSAALPRIGEPRWIPAVAVLLFMAVNIALHIWRPEEAAFRIP